jgi:hypothetical protein
LVNISGGLLIVAIGASRQRQLYDSALMLLLPLVVLWASQFVAC